MLILTGCATLTPTKTELKSNPALPVVKEFKAYPDRNAIALFWSPITSMSGYYIQRYDEKNKRWIEIATINNPYKSIYVDTNLLPNHFYKYRIASFNKNKIPSLAKETQTKTMPPLSPVIPLEAKPLKKGSIKLIFRPHQNERVNEYLIQKYNDQKAKWEDLATLKPRLNVEYIDNGLEDGKIYKYRIFAKSFDNIKSFPSKIIKVSTYPKPPIITNIIATKNLPKKIVLKFSPVKNAKYYKIYISDYPNGEFKFYTKTTSTEFVDNVEKDGFIRYYKVTAVSPYDTESILKETPAVMGESLTKPASPIVSTNKTDSLIEFTFISPDKRAVKYLVVKKEKEGLFKEKEKKFLVNSDKFQDSINPKKSYIYEIYEVDKYGLISKKPSIVEVN